MPVGDLIARAITEPGVIMGHDHSSGDPPLSAEDVGLRARLRRAGTLLGIVVLDVVIIGDGRSYSFEERGR